MEAFDISVKRFDEFASEYAVRFEDIDSYRKHFDEFCNLIDTRNPSILELACGPGNVTGYLKHRFPDSKIVGIDLAPGMIDIARQNISGVDFRLMDVRDINTLDYKFDSIMCSFCLPFLSKLDTDKLISDCSDKLLKNGKLYLSTMEGDESRAGLESTSFSGNSKVYFNYHRKEDIEKSLINSGFSIEYNICQKYYELDGSITIDLIMIAKKN